MRSLHQNLEVLQLHWILAVALIVHDGCSNFTFFKILIGFSEHLDETDASQRFLESSSDSNVLSICSVDSVPTISKGLSLEFLLKFWFLAAKHKDGKIHSFKALYFDARVDDMTPRELWGHTPVRTPENTANTNSKASAKNAEVQSHDSKPSSKPVSKSSCTTCTSKSMKIRKARSNAQIKQRRKVNYYDFLIHFFCLEFTMGRRN